MATLDAYNYDGLDTGSDFNFNPDSEFSFEGLMEEEEEVQEQDNFDFSGLIPTPTKKPKPAQQPSASTTKGGKVRSGYGARKDPVTGKAAFHGGLDIPLPLNTPLKPFGVGTVVFAGKRGNYGNAVGIDYGNGVTIFLNHLNEVKVEAGDRVRPEAIIGLSGSTGKSTGPHTHLEARRDGKVISPFEVFANDPREAGINLILKGLQSNEGIVDTTSAKIDEGFDFSGQLLTEEEGDSELNFSGLESEEAEILPQEQKDESIIQFQPAEKEKPPVGRHPYETLWKNLNLGRMARGVGGAMKYKPVTRVANPNPAGKPITLNLAARDGKPPTVKDVVDALVNSLGPQVKAINDKFVKEKEVRESGIQSIVGLTVPVSFGAYDRVIYPEAKKNADGTYQVTIKSGIPKGVIDQINAYARGGMEAYKGKRNELIEQSELYSADLQRAKAEAAAQEKVDKERHPYKTAFKRGLQDAALSEISLAHNLRMLPEAFWISQVHGFNSEEYEQLIKKDIETRLPIMEAEQSIPASEGLAESVVRGATSAAASLPRFAAFGKLGQYSLPLMVYAEKMHRGHREAALGALPMAVMVGGQTGLERFLSSAGASLSGAFRKTALANDDIITSISAKSPGNVPYLIAKELSDLSGIPIRTIEFSAVTPLQRQLVMRGQNALTNVGVSALTSPEFTLQEGVTQLIVGAGLPVGKFGRRGAEEFRRPAILQGDAYTLKDGSILLMAPIDPASGLISGRVPVDTSTGIAEARVPTTNYGRKLLTTPIEGNVVTRPLGSKLPWGQKGVALRTEKPTVIQGEDWQIKARRSLILDVDTAALNLIELRRALETGAYLPEKPIEGTVFQRAKDEAQRKADLQVSIRLLDEAIPKETQKFFEENEAVFREARKTNYQDRIRKEEFIKGRKILAKSPDKITAEDVRPFNPESRTADKDTVVQKMRRAMVSVEDAGRKGLERNKANKGTFSMGVDPSDVPYYVQIAIGKIGREALDFAQFSREMIAEFGDEISTHLNKIYGEARMFVDAVNGLANVMPDADYTKAPPFKVKDYDDVISGRNIFYIMENYLTSAEERDIPLDRVIATQKGVAKQRLLMFGEKPNVALEKGVRDITGELERPKAIKIGDDYYLADGHHRTSAAKLRGETAIRGRVIDFADITSGKVKSRYERAAEKFGEVGKDNKYFTQEKQLQVREEVFRPPNNNELQEGVTGTAKWFTEQTSNLVQIVGFHVEDFYRRGVEPNFSEIIGRLRSEFGNWVDTVGMDRWRDIYNRAIKYYETNNAEPFYSPLKQNILEKFPDGNVNPKTAKNIIEKLASRNELEWTTGLLEGIDKHIATGKKISKKQLIDFIQENQVKVEEVSLGNKLSTEEYAKLKELKAKYLARQATADEIEQIRILDNKRITDYQPTQWDLKTYGGEEKLELEGAIEGSSREILLQIPKKTFTLETLPENVRIEDISREENGGHRVANPFELIVDYNSMGYFATAQRAVDSYNALESSYQSPHWRPFKNVFAHFRANMRNLVDGITKVYHGEEFQSDLMQSAHTQFGYDMVKFLNEKGVKIETEDGVPKKYGEAERLVKGYNDPISNKILEERGFSATVLKEEQAWHIVNNYKFDFEEKLSSDAEAAIGRRTYIVYKLHDPTSGLILQSEYHYPLKGLPNPDPKKVEAKFRRMEVENLIAESRARIGERSLPKNPFMENNWKEIAFKRFIRDAIERGADGVTWTTARQQQERYHKVVEGKVVLWEKDPYGKFNLKVDTGDGNFRSTNQMRNLSLEEVRELTNQGVVDQIVEATENFVPIQTQIDMAIAYLEAHPQHKIAKIPEGYTTRLDPETNTIQLMRGDFPILDTGTKELESANRKIFKFLNKGIVTSADKIRVLEEVQGLIKRQPRYAWDVDFIRDHFHRLNTAVEGDTYFYKLQAWDELVNDFDIQGNDVARKGQVGLEDTIRIGKGYEADYDGYYVNLARKLGRRFGNAKYEMREIETAPKKEAYAEIYPRELLEKELEALRSKQFDIIPAVQYPRFDRVIMGLDGTVLFHDLNNQHFRLNDDQFTEIAIKTKENILAELEPKIEQVHFLEITPEMRDSILKEGLPTYGLPSQEAIKPSAPIGIRNRIISRDAFDLAKNEITTSLLEARDEQGTVFNSGLNPDAFLDQIKLFYKGITDFADFSRELTKKYGEEIQPHIEPIWNWIKDFYQDETGALQLPKLTKRAKLSDTKALDVFEDSQVSRLRRLSYHTHRGIALAQTYPDQVKPIYSTMRDLQRTVNSYSTTILEQLTRAVSALQKDTDQTVAKAIFTRNHEEINDPLQDDAIVTRFNMNADQEAAYRYTRGSVKNVLEVRKQSVLYTYREQGRKLNDDLLAATPGTPKHDAILEKMVDLSETMDKVEQYYEDLKNKGYISLQRLGRYRAEAQDPAYPVGDDRRLLVDFMDTPVEAQERINEWKRDHAAVDEKISDAHDPDQFDEIARKLTPSEFEELVVSSGVNPTDAHVEAIRAEVYERFPTMGYQLKRKFYRGYQKNNRFMLQSIAHQANVYESAFYNNVGREEGLKALEDSGLKTSDVELYKTMKQYIIDETSTPRYNLFDKASFKARKFTYLMQLGANIKQLYLNLFVQPVTQNYSYLARIENPTTGKRLGGIKEVESVFLQGTKLALKVAKESFGRKTLKDATYKEFRTIYDQLIAERVIEPSYTKSLLELEAETPIGLDRVGTLKERAMKLKQWEHWAGGFMRAGEKGTRTHMAASLFIAGKRFGLSGDALTNFIVEGVDATQTNPTRGENPAAIRGFGEFGKLFYQFGAFRHMWFENLALNFRSDIKHRSAAATTRTLAPLAVMAGIKGLPLTGFAFTLYALATGKNPEEEIKKALAKMAGDNDFLENIVLNGITTNASFSQSAGIQAPFVDNFGDLATQDSVIDRVFSNNIPFVMTTKQIGSGLSGIASGVYEQDMSKFLRGIEEGAPFQPVRQLLRGLRIAREGYRTKSGTTLVPPTQVTPADIVIQTGLGLTPNKVIEKLDDRKYKRLKRSTLGKASRKLTRKVLQ